MRNAATNIGKQSVEHGNVLYECDVTVDRAKDNVFVVVISLHFICVPLWYVCVTYS